jgi:hypothetical protein
MREVRVVVLLSSSPSLCELLARVGASWLAGCLAGWLVGWLAGWLAGCWLVVVFGSKLSCTNPWFFLLVVGGGIPVRVVGWVSNRASASPAEV